MNKFKKKEIYYSVEKRTRNQEAKELVIIRTAKL